MLLIQRSRGRVSRVRPGPDAHEIDATSAEFRDRVAQQHIRDSAPLMTGIDGDHVDLPAVALSVTRGPDHDEAHSSLIHDGDPNVVPWVQTCSPNVVGLRGPPVGVHEREDFWAHHCLKACVDRLPSGHGERNDGLEIGVDEVPDHSVVVLTSTSRLASPESQPLYRRLEDVPPGDARSLAL